MTEDVRFEELAEIERLVSEAKGLIPAGTDLGYWQGKTPCWVMCSCPSSLFNQCPSYRLRSMPCWEMEGTYCKLEDYGATGRDISICQVCRVYKRYGNGAAIEIKLFGQGIDPDFLAHYTPGQKGP